MLIWGLLKHTQKAGMGSEMELFIYIERPFNVFQRRKGLCTQQTSSGGKQLFENDNLDPQTHVIKLL